MNQDATSTNTQSSDANKAALPYTPSPDLLRLLIDNSPDALLLVSAEGVIIFANETCQLLLGYAPEELIGRSPECLVPDAFRAGHKKSREDYTRNPTRRAMGRLNSLTALTKAGDLIPVDIALSPIPQDQGKITAVVIRDAKAQRAFVHQLEHLATTDGLTGALNRRSFEHAYRREYERTRRGKSGLFLLMLDIDFFKKINDRYGHGAGDQALKMLVSTCSATVRKTDAFARFGGEEFAVLTPASDAAEAMGLAERLRRNVAKIRVPDAAGAFGFTISIGLSKARDSLDETLAEADKALYQAKATGRNRVVQAV